MPRLQKNLNVQPTVASVGNPVEPDTSTAEAIQSVGGAVKSFVTQKKKSDITEELKALGDEVFAVNTGKELDRSTERIDRLKQAKEQGVLSDTMVKIEAESILKESIDSMPGLAPELRQHVARTLGYDPTGSQIRALLNVPDAGGGNAFAEKQRERAEFVAQNLDLNVDDVMKLQAKNIFRKQQAELIAQQAKIGAAGRDQVRSATLAEADGFIADFMSDALASIKSGEGLQNKEVLNSQLHAQVAAQKQLLRDRYREAGITPDAKTMSQELGQIDEQYEPVFEMIESGSIENVLKNNAQALNHAMAIEGFNVFGDIAAINKAGGQSAVDHYFTVLRKYGDEDQMALLKANNPALARNVESIDDLTKRASSAYKRIIGEAPSFDATGRFGEATPEEESANNALEDKILFDTIRTGAIDEDTRNKVLDYVRSEGKKFKALGAYFKSGVRSLATPEEKQWIKQTFEEEYPQLVGRVSSQLAELSNKDVDIALNDRGELELVNKNLDHPMDVMVSTSPAAGTASAIASNPVIRADLKRINAFLRGSKSGWSDILGTEADNFSAKTLNQIKSTSREVVEEQENINEALTRYENDPSEENLEALRELAPDLVSSVEGEVLRGGGNNDAQ